MVELGSGCLKLKLLYKKWRAERDNWIESERERSKRWERELLVTLCWVRPFSIAILMKTSNAGCPFHGLRSCDVVVEPWENLQPLPPCLRRCGCWRSCCRCCLAIRCLQDFAQHPRGPACSTFLENNELLIRWMCSNSSMCNTWLEWGGQPQQSTEWLALEAFIRVWGPEYSLSCLAQPFLGLHLCYIPCYTNFQSYLSGLHMRHSSTTSVHPRHRLWVRIPSKIFNKEGIWLQAGAGGREGGGKEVVREEAHGNLS